MKRGLYVVVPPGADPDSYSIDPFLIAAKLTDVVVSLSKQLTVTSYADKLQSLIFNFVDNHHVPAYMEFSELIKFAC